MSKKSLKISNIGGCHELVVPLDKPGIYELRSDNGLGKSSAINAVSRALGGAVPVERTDGSDEGRVELLSDGFPEVLLRVTGVARGEGRAEIALADTGPLAVLIDPNVKGDQKKGAQDPRNRARIKALVDLVRLPVDDQAIASLAGGVPEVEGWLKREVHDRALDDVLTAAELAREERHRRARDREQAAATAGGEAQTYEKRLQTLRGQLEALGLPLVAVEQCIPTNAAGAARDAARMAERARIQADARQEQERRIEEIRATLGEQPSGAETAARVLAAVGAVDRLQAKIGSLRKQLATAEGELKAAAAERVTAGEADIAIGRAQRQWEERKAALDAPVTGPTEDEVAAAEMEATSAQLTAEQHQISADFHSAYQDAALARKAESDAAVAVAVERAAAHAVSGAVSAILDRAGVPNIALPEGRLAWTNPDTSEVLDWDKRMSDGQRVRAALDLAARFYPSGVVPLDGKFWMALSPHRRAEFADLAASLNLRVITERATDDASIKVEHLGGGA